MNETITTHSTTRGDIRSVRDGIPTKNLLFLTGITVWDVSANHVPKLQRYGTFLRNVKASREAHISAAKPDSEEAEIEIRSWIEPIYLKHAGTLPSESIKWRSYAEPKTSLIDRVKSKLSSIS